jgi:hypothetical protein
VREAEMKMVVLAKSDKQMKNGSHGFCVAGINEKGDWIRLVSDISGDSLSIQDCKAFNCLDVLDLEAIACPIDYQPENVRLMRLKRTGSLTINQVIARFGITNSNYLFVNDDYKLTENQMKNTDCSLMIAKVDDFEVYKNENNKIKAKFIYRGRLYTNVSVTDPKGYSEKRHGTVYIVVSIPANSYETYGYFKFVAAIYPV